MDSLQNGIISYWTFDDNLRDYNGSNHGTGTSVSYTAGKINSAVLYNTSSTVQTPGDLYKGLSKISFSFWVYSPDFLFPIFLNKQNSFEIRYDGTLGYGIHLKIFSADGTTSATIRNGSSTMILNSWNHIVFTYDGSLSDVDKVKLYINGQSALTVVSGTVPISSFLNLVSNNLIIGSNLNGSMDEVGIWNRPITYLEVQQLYNNGNGLSYPFFDKSKIFYSGIDSSLSSGVVSYYNFDSNTNDSLGISNGSGTSITYGIGKIYEAAIFNGTSSKILFNPIIVNTNWSLSFWFKPSSSSVGIRPIIAGSTNVKNMYFYNNLSELHYNGTFAASSFPIRDVWYHVVLQVTNDVGQFYVNGVIDGPSGSTGGLTTFTSFGYSSFFDLYQDGSLDEFGIWNRTLSTVEIAQLYLGRSQYPFKKRISTSNSFTNLNTGLVSYYALDGHVNDALNVNNGTPFGIEYTAATINKGAVFSGIATTYVDIGTTSSFSFMQNTGVFTIALWVKFKDVLTVPQYILSSTATGSEKGLFVGTWETPYRAVMVLTNGTNNVITAVADNVYPNNNWNHIAVVGDGVNITFYTNGVGQLASGSMSGFSTGNSTRTMYMGKINGGFFNDAFNGTMDELGIWNRALSSEEVNRLYRGRTQYPFGDKIFKSLLKYEQEVLNWSAQMSVAPSDSYLFNLNVMVKRLKDVGIWNELDRFWVYATEQQEHARIDIKNLQSHTEVNNPVWIANQGYNSNGSTSYIDTNYNASIDSDNYTLNSASFGVYSRTNNTLFSTDIGMYNSSPNTFSQIYIYNSGNHAASVNETSATLISSAFTTTTGLFSTSRTGDTFSALYKNGIELVTSSQVSNFLPQRNMYVLCRNSDGVAGNFSTKQLSLTFIGSGNIDQAVLYSIIQSFASSQRFNV